MKVAFRRTIKLESISLPEVPIPDMATQLGTTLSQMMMLLTRWEALGKTPFTQVQLAEQFPPSAPLQDAFKALLGSHGARWEDASLSPTELAAQVVPLQLLEVTIDQLKKMREKHVGMGEQDPEDETDYEAAAETLAAHSRSLYSPY